jgi:Fe-S cluster assembly iron-binding protein IscA
VIRFTDRARERLARLIDHLDEDACLRLSRSGGSPLAPDYDLAIVELDSRAGDEGLIEADGIRVLMPDDPPGPLLIDFHDGPGPSGFQVHGEGAAIPSSGGSLEERVRRVIEDRVNPGVASHGGPWWPRPLTGARNPDCGQLPRQTARVPHNAASSQITSTAVVLLRPRRTSRWER